MRMAVLIFNLSIAMCSCYGYCCCRRYVYGYSLHLYQDWAFRKLGFSKEGKGKVALYNFTELGFWSLRVSALVRARFCLPNAATLGY